MLNSILPFSMVNVPVFDVNIHLAPLLSYLAISIVALVNSDVMFPMPLSPGSSVRRKERFRTVLRTGLAIETEDLSGRTIR